MIILFFLPDDPTARAMGEKWDSKVSLPSLGETYNIANTIQSVVPIGAMEVGVHQEITRRVKDGESRPTLKATADSLFAAATGKLIKSRVDCDVAFDPGQIAAAGGKTRNAKQEQAKLTANIKIDIALVK